jgi:serine/threonine-protein kinase
MKTIGRYEIIGLLGRGGMGKVYKVRLPVLDKVAALKCLEPSWQLAELIGMDKLREQFIFEAKIIANLRHPNILDVWNLEEENGKLWYLMDYFSHNLGVMIGETYWADSPSRIIRIEKAVHYTTEILQGLCRLHHAGIIHRDIKPFNMMITDQDSVKIADFGLSKVRGENSEFPKHLMIGTKFYAAPEQEAAPDAVDFSADIYSVGVILYRMLTGILPQDSVDPPSRFNQDIDSEWDAFILKAIAPKPDRRFPAANVMLHQLQLLYNRFREKQEKTCRILENQTHKFKTAQEKIRLRSDEISVTSQHAKAAFKLNELWRPIEYIQHQLNPDTDGVIIDHTTGLAWQQSGSEYPQTSGEAQSYIGFLNETRFGGYANWRLPTIDELISLLKPSSPGEDFCFESLFDNRQKWIQSADRRSLKSGWYVNVELGFVATHNIADLLYTKAVCTI